MRTIDGDALEIEYEEQMKKLLSSTTHDNMSAEALSLLCGSVLIRETPTIEPERKKGIWIPQDHNKHHGMTSTAVYYFPRCSVCGESANYTNYCPNCGADMRRTE